MGNQYYLIIENPLEQNDKINFGFRVDNLFGNDWVFNHMRGLNEHSFRLNHFAGYDPAQIYGEVHLPFLTKGGIDIKGGRFYTILGYEVVPATGRPLLSVPYMFNYGQPFTHLGMLSTLHVTDRDQHATTARSTATTAGSTRTTSGTTSAASPGPRRTARRTWPSPTSSGPNQYPRFLSAEHRRSSCSATRSRRTRPAAATSATAATGRISFTNVFSYKWTDKLTQVIETDESYREQHPRAAAPPTAFPGPTATTAGTASATGSSTPSTTS